MFRLTPIVKNLIIINVIVFVAQNLPLFGEFATCFPGAQVGLRENIITGYLSLWNIWTDCFKPYQLFTYMFVHGSVSHIFFNMLGLVIFGPTLEAFWGAKRFTLFFMITGIGAGVFNILIDKVLGQGSFSHMLGASGAVYGILTAFGLTFPNMELRPLFLPVSFKAKYLVIGLGAMTIYSTFHTGQGDNTAHMAHLGGIVIAIILVQLWRGRGQY